jgi:hypothetical protein
VSPTTISRSPSRREEIAPERAVEVVAVARPVDAVDLHLGQHAEVAQHRKADVLQRERDELAVRPAGRDGAGPPAARCRS